MAELAPLLAPVAAGLIVGVLSGLLGIGGGTVLVPVFRLMFGMNPLAATATSLFTIIPTSLSGAVSHIRGKTCIAALGAAMGLGGALTSSLGVWLAARSPDWAIMLAASLVIGYSALNMIRKGLKKPVKSPEAARGSEGLSEPGSSDENEVTPGLSRKQLVLGFAIGLCAGVISGYVGVGGGFVMIPLMVSVLGLPMKQASGTSLIAVMMLAAPAVISHMAMGNVDYWAGIAVALGSIPGAMLGARLVRRVPERALKLLFGCFLLVAAMLLAVNETGWLG
ncbi:MAG: sulfite exporter TauE/SafE family protein [Eggerthellaceae bacterium]|nr:sulfite exporter TauE/SafE family protein [Eggerthellaceae bacterium]